MEGYGSILKCVHKGYVTKFIKQQRKRYIQNGRHDN